MRNIFIAITIMFLFCAESIGPASAQDKNEVLTVSAQQLYTDYQKNEVAADLKYKNKLIRISGAVSKVGVDIAHEPFVMLAVGQEFSGVQLVFDDNWTQQLAKLNIRDHINDQLCVGAGMVLNPMLNCTIPAIHAVEQEDVTAPDASQADDTNSGSTVPISDGSCRSSAISEISHRLEANGHPITDSGSALKLADGLYLVSYDESAVVHGFKVGDEVTACMVTTETHCPSGTKSSDGYIIINSRTKTFWSAYTSEHSCLGE